MSTTTLIVIILILLLLGGGGYGYRAGWGGGPVGGIGLIVLVLIVLLVMGVIYARLVAQLYGTLIASIGGYADRHCRPNRRIHSRRNQLPGDEHEQSTLRRRRHCAGVFQRRICERHLEVEIRAGSRIG